LILDYVRLPSGKDSYPRPLVSVQLEGLPEAPLTCLVDSGAVHNRFPKDFADEAGISLDNPDYEDTFWAGGVKYTGPVVRVQLRIDSLEWEAPVCFIGDWQQDFGLLGHEGFFRWFRVCFHAADEQLSLEPVER
jgi:hypothetical protein